MVAAGGDGFGQKLQPFGLGGNSLQKTVSLLAEMEKRVDIVDISVLIFSYSCANFLAVHVQTS